MSLLMLMLFLKEKNIYGWDVLYALDRKWKAEILNDSHSSPF